VEEVRASQVVPPPNGFLSAKIDEKGRLKLPSKIEEYFASLGVRSFFITSLDRTTIRVYSQPEWQKSKTFLFQNKDDRQTARRILFAANDVGGDSDIDSQGRILIPQKLRALLSLENQNVQMECLDEIITIYTQARYESTLQQALEDLEENVRSMEEKGLK